MGKASHPNQAQELDGRAFGGRLTINLVPLQKNYRAIVAHVKPAQVSAVVKADAYGLGVAQVAPALYAAGCRLFFVAQLVEAFRLRPYLPLEAHIGVLNDFQPAQAATVADAGFLPVLNSLESIREWQQLCQVRGQKLPAIIQIDSGMARLGLDVPELERLARDPDIFALADIRYIISHLACADVPENAQNQTQLETFRRALRRLPPTPVAFANSAGVFLTPDFTPSDFIFDMVRPGLALYGIDPQGKNTNILHPTLTLEARIIQVRQVEAGTRIGYGGSYQAEQPMRVATMAVGYGDGWPRALSNKGSVFWHGVRLPIIGHVSMDSTTLDISHLPPDALDRGDLIELIGPHQAVADVARDAGTIPYEILTQLGRRYERRYING